MKVIVNVLVKEDDKVLMIQENWGDYVGMWNFPAGHLDENENIFDGAIREAKEETGYDVELTGLLEVQNSVYDDRHVIHFCFTAKRVGGEVSFDENEIMNCEFVEIERLLNMSEKELRGAISRKETLRKLQSGKVIPLEFITNFDFRNK